MRDRDPTGGACISPKGHTRRAPARAKTLAGPPAMPTVSSFEPNAAAAPAAAPASAHGLTTTTRPKPVLVGASRGATVTTKAGTPGFFGPTCMVPSECVAAGRARSEERRVGE